MARVEFEIAAIRYGPYPQDDYSTGRQISRLRGQSNGYLNEISSVVGASSCLSILQVNNTTLCVGLNNWNPARAMNQTYCIFAHTPMPAVPKCPSLHTIMNDHKFLIVGRLQTSVADKQGKGHHLYTTYRNREMPNGQGETLFEAAKQYSGYHILG